MFSAFPGALHSMLGAMDKRVSEEVRKRGGVLSVLSSRVNPTPGLALPDTRSPPGHEGLLHPLPVRGRRLLLPEGALPPGLQRGHEPADPHSKCQPHAGEEPPSLGPDGGAQLREGQAGAWAATR